MYLPSQILLIINPTCSRFLPTSLVTVPCLALHYYPPRRRYTKNERGGGFYGSCPRPLSGFALFTLLAADTQRMKNERGGERRRVVPRGENGFGRYCQAVFVLRWSGSSAERKISDGHVGCVWSSHHHHVPESTPPFPTQPGFGDACYDGFGFNDDYACYIYERWRDAADLYLAYQEVG